MSVAKQMLAAHPWEGDVDRDVLSRCIAACFECAQACTACADACLSEKGVEKLRKCIRLDLVCADICEVTGRVLTRQTEYDAPTSRAQLEACITCAQECESHAGHHEHCRICAEACRRCEEACDQLTSVMK